MDRPHHLGEPVTDILVPHRGSGPGVVVAHPWWGLNATIRDYGRRLAAEGFVVALPDLFEGNVASSIEAAQALADRQWSPDAAHLIVEAARDLGRHEAVTSARQGVVGFSYGGYFALGLAARRDMIAGIVTYYAARELPPDHVPLLCHFAQTDPFESDESMRAVADVLSRSGAPSAAHFYAGTRHWFAEADRPEFEAAAARLAFERTTAFLRSVLTE